MARAKRFVVVTFSYLCFSASLLSAIAQEKPPSGEGVWQGFNIDIPNRYHEIAYNRKALNIHSFTGKNPLTGLRDATLMLFWTPPKGKDIIYACTKTDNPDIVFILLDDGSIYETVFDGTENTGYDDPPRFRSKADAKDGFQAYEKIIGDALYTLSSVAAYVSRDLAATWKADTAGVGGGTYNDLALDTSQYAWLAHSTGLWKQISSNTWRKVNSYPWSLASAVFVDRRNRILAAAFQQVFLSTNSGSTWAIDTTGLGGQVINMFCDDAYGNLYAMSDTRVWKSAGRY